MSSVLTDPRRRSQTRSRGEGAAAGVDRAFQPERGSCIRACFPGAVPYSDVTAGRRFARHPAYRVSEAPMRAQHVRKRAAATGQYSRLRPPASACSSPPALPLICQEETRFGAAPGSSRCARRSTTSCRSREELFHRRSRSPRLDLPGEQGTVRLFEFLVGPLAPGAKRSISPPRWCTSRRVAAMSSQLARSSATSSAALRPALLADAPRRDGTARSPSVPLQGRARGPADARGRSRRRDGGAGAADALPQRRSSP